MAMPKNLGTLGSMERPFSQLDENFQKAVWEATQKALRAMGEHQKMTICPQSAGYFRLGKTRNLCIQILVTDQT